MKLTGKQKKYIKKNIKNQSIEKIALSLGINPDEIRKFIKNRWGDQKYRQKSEDPQTVLFCIPQDFSLVNFSSHHKFRIIFLGFLTVLIYAFALPNEFVSDDIGMFTAGGDIEKPGYITSSAVSMFKNLVNWSVYKVFHDSAPAFRMINIIQHAGVVVTLFLILSLITSGFSAMLAAIIIAIHPIFTESVVWVSAGNYIQYSLFFLLSVFFYLLSKKPNDAKILHPKPFTLNPDFLLSFVFFTLSLPTSEKAIVLWLVFIAYEFVFGNLKSNWRKLLPFVSISLVWSALIFFYFPYVQTRIDASHAVSELRIYNPLVQIPVAITSYLRLIMLPLALSLYHPITALSIPVFILHLLVFLGFVAFIAWSFLKNKPVFFWLMLFLISLIPTFSPIIISWVVAERYVYLGSIGLIVAFVLIILPVIHKLPDKKLFYFPLVVLFLLFSIRTVLRNFDWKNYETLYTATVKTAPTDPRARNNMGDVYMRKGEFEKAEKEFNLALKLRPRYAGTIYNLGLLRYKQNNIPDALNYLNQSLNFDPKFLLSYQLLSSIYYEQKNYPKTIEVIRKALPIDPNNPLVHFNLGNAYLKSGDKQRAKTAFTKTLELDPQNQYARNLLQKINDQSSTQSGELLN